MKDPLEPLFGLSLPRLHCLLQPLSDIQVSAGHYSSGSTLSHAGPHTRQILSRYHSPHNDCLSAAGLLHSVDIPGAAVATIAFVIHPLILLQFDKKTDFTGGRAPVPYK